jgi:hypothetical protein
MRDADRPRRGITGLGTQTIDVRLVAPVAASRSISPGVCLVGRP